jgi:DivIVA domain-containing protein
MSITPQAIKDQEFQVKFRGYDPIEVKAYLDLVAEEFFDLHELKRKQEEEYAELDEKYQKLLREKEELVRAARDNEAYAEETQKEHLAWESQLAEIQRQVDRLEGLVKDLEQEKADLLQGREGREKDLSQEVQTLRDTIGAKQEAENQSGIEVEKLRLQLTLVEKQTEDLKKNDVVFKSTIIAAQNFADDLRKKSEQEAREIMDRAHAEVENYRRKAEEELSGLPVEIERLNRQRLQVKDDLKAILKSYLEKLEAFGDAGAGEHTEEDIPDLFQSITLADDGAVSPDELEQITMELGISTDKE